MTKRTKTLINAAISLLMLALPLPALAASNPANMPTVASIAALQALGAASSQYAAINVASYYASQNSGGGVFVWVPGSTATAEPCVVIQASGVTTGRWFRQIGTSAIDYSQCGAKADDTTDATATITAAYAAALAYKKELTCSGIYKITGLVLTPSNAQGVITRGTGIAAPNGVNTALGQNGNCTLDGKLITTGTGWVIDYSTPYPGFGNSQSAAPKFYDMNIWASQSANMGGCIRFNSIAGGFTDDNTSQQPVMKPIILRVFCQADNIAGTVQVAFQCSKCFDGDFSLNESNGAQYGIDIEGSDVMSIGGAGGNRIQGTLSNPVRLVSHGSFGNMDRVIGNEILSPRDVGQTLSAWIYDSARSSVIADNHIEGHVANTTSTITIDGGFSHSIHDNDIDTQLTGSPPTTNWLVVTGNLINLSVFNNGNAGIEQSPASFNAGAGSLYWYNGVLRQEIFHGNNTGAGDQSFPMQTQPDSDNIVVQQATTDLLFGCAVDGLSPNTLGIQVKCVNNALTFPATGVGNPLLFDNFRSQPVFGTLNLRVKASSASGAQLCGQFTDAAVVVGAFTCQTLTAAPLWYTIKSGIAIVTRVGAYIYAANSDVRLWSGAISN